MMWKIGDALIRCIKSSRIFVLKNVRIEIYNLEPRILSWRIFLEKKKSEFDFKITNFNCKHFFHNSF